MGLTVRELDLGEMELDAVGLEFDWGRVKRSPRDAEGEITDGARGEAEGERGEKEDMAGGEVEMVKLESAAEKVETEALEIEGGEVERESLKCDRVQETHVARFGRGGTGAWSKNSSKGVEKRGWEGSRDLYVWVPRAWELEERQTDVCVDKGGQEQCVADALGRERARRYKPVAFRGAHAVARRLQFRHFLQSIAGSAHYSKSHTI